MTRTRTLAIAASFLLSAALAVPAVAQTRRPAADRGRAPQARQAMRAAMARIGLSDAQRSRIHDIRTAHAQSIASLRAQQRASAAELQALLTSAQPEPSAVGAAMLQARSDRKALRAAQKAVRDDVLAVLSPEQRGELKAYLDVARTRARSGGRGRGLGR